MKRMSFHVPDRRKSALYTCTNPMIPYWALVKPESHTQNHSKIDHSRSEHEFCTITGQNDAHLYIPGMVLHPPYHIPKTRIPGYSNTIWPFGWLPVMRSCFLTVGMLHLSAQSRAPGPTIVLETHTYVTAPSYRKEEWHS